MKLTSNQFNRYGYFLNRTEDIETLKDKNSVQMFDQNGYHLTKAEQTFLNNNGYQTIERRVEDCIRQDWFIWDRRDNVHINHSDLFERKGFKAEALNQLEELAIDNPMLYKVAKMKPKWGIDISLDFVSKDRVFEVFHYEWDAFEFNLVDEKKEELEEQLNLFLEKNVPNDPSKWSYAKAQAKKKYDVYPSLYANAWASNKYKELGGTWRKSKKSKKSKK